MEQNDVTRVVVEEGITSIPDGIFRDYTKLNRVGLPSTVHTVSAGTFSGCTGIVSVEYAGKLSDWENVNIGAGNDVLSEHLQTASFATANDPASVGQPGSSVIAYLDGDTLMIEGTGKMQDFEDDDPLWYPERESIRTVRISRA